jgi:hypothetical protein
MMDWLDVMGDVLMMGRVMMMKKLCLRGKQTLHTR